MARPRSSHRERFAHWAEEGAAKKKNWPLPRDEGGLIFSRYGASLAATPFEV